MSRFSKETHLLPHVSGEQVSDWSVKMLVLKVRCLLVDCKPTLRVHTATSSECVDASLLKSMKTIWLCIISAVYQL